MLPLVQVASERISDQAHRRRKVQYQRRFESFGRGGLLVKRGVHQSGAEAVRNERRERPRSGETRIRFGSPTGCFESRSIGGQALNDQSRFTYGKVTFFFLQSSRQSVACRSGTDNVWFGKGLSISRQGKVAGQQKEGGMGAISTGVRLSNRVQRTALADRSSIPL